MALPGNAVWFITGCSSGFGRLLAAAALARGDRVVATARNPATIADLAGERALVLALDVIDGVSVQAAVDAAVARFGGIDILVNNAGYGYIAAVEEGEDAGIRALFDVNVFGLADVTRRVLPVLRRRQGGWIVNLSSIAGIAPNPGVGYYAASKAAVEGLSDALAIEVAPFGIRVLVVEPGPFKTDFAGRSLKLAPAHPDYAETPAGRRRAAVGAPQGGDPARAVALVVEALAAAEPPLRLVVGGNAIGRALARTDAFRRDIEAWRVRSAETDGQADRA
ncbi:oxidoreductase [Zavarzinia compransoris]|uniref:Short-chain dehydrogenase/reductase n=1 Tax=Zavarzinia compransoris TaxID=1264899 RepID=A0A317DSZ8_9PROT|nr:oxidoreductase [Zavarzinia compransoris]PWR17807.1 short-chain dehydrogenase/reductase [Zavarzinia compransoris]TDP49340.1 short-subunit dehydrogenase [Zavarzinia compransoris]